MSRKGLQSSREIPRHCVPRDSHPSWDTRLSVSHPCCSRPARSIRSLTIEYPLKDASPEERSDEGSLLSFVTPFGSYSCALFHFAYILFSTTNSLPSIACALFRKTRGVAWVSSHFGTEHP